MLDSIYNGTQLAMLAFIPIADSEAFEIQLSVCAAVPWAYQAIWLERIGKSSMKTFSPETIVERCHPELTSARAESFISVCAFMRGRHKERQGLCMCISPSGSLHTWATDLNAHSAGGEGESEPHIGHDHDCRSPKCHTAAARLFTPRSRP